jgi:hypothetical protein
MFKFKATRRLINFLQAWGKVQRAFKAKVAANHRQWDLEKEARKPLPRWGIYQRVCHAPAPPFWFVEERSVETGFDFQQAEQLAERYNCREVEDLLQYREDTMRRIRIDASIADAKAWLAANC